MALVLSAYGALDHPNIIYLVSTCSPDGTTYCIHDHRREPEWNTPDSTRTEIKQLVIDCRIRWCNSARDLDVVDVRLLFWLHLLHQRLVIVRVVQKTVLREVLHLVTKPRIRERMASNAELCTLRFSSRRVKQD